MNRPNMGHWINLQDVNHNFTDMEKIRLLLPGMQGFLIRYNWSSLETKGTYDFSSVIADLDRCAAHGLMAVIMPMDKSFGPQFPSAVPDYLSKFTSLNDKRGLSAIRWAPEVQTAFGRLLDRVSRFQNHPAFEGIMLTETAPSIVADITTLGYTPDKYQAVYVDWLTRTDARLFWQCNFIPPRNEAAVMKAVMAMVDPSRVFIGGPDVLPNNQALLTRTYPTWQLFQNNFATMSMDSYAAGPCASVSAFAATLNVKWLFWTYCQNFTEQTALINAGY